MTPKPSRDRRERMAILSRIPPPGCGSRDSYAGVRAGGQTARMAVRIIRVAADLFSV